MTAPSPHQISTFDSPGNPSVPCMLTGENYDTWAMAMKNALLARKKKLGFIDRDFAKTQYRSTRVSILAYLQVDGCCSVDFLLAGQVTTGQHCSCR